MPEIKTTSNLKIEKPEAQHAAWEQAYWRLATLVDLWLTQIAKGHHVVSGGGLTLNGADVELADTVVAFAGQGAPHPIAAATAISGLTSGRTYVVYADDTGALQVSNLDGSNLWAGTLPAEFVLLGLVYEVEGAWTIHALPLDMGRGKAQGLANVEGVTTVVAADSPKTLTLAHTGLVLLDATAGAVTVMLPPAAALAAARFVFVRLDASGNTVTVQRSGADTISPGGTSVTLAGENTKLELASDGVGTWLAGILAYTQLATNVLDAADPPSAWPQGVVTQAVSAGNGWGPGDEGGWVLTLTQDAASDRCEQLFFNTTGARYIRTSASAGTGWGAWTRMLTSDLSGQQIEAAGTAFKASSGDWRVINGANQPILYAGQDHLEAFYQGDLRIQTTSTGVNLPGGYVKIGNWAQLRAAAESDLRLRSSDDTDYADLVVRNLNIQGSIIGAVVGRANLKTSQLSANTTVADNITLPHADYGFHPGLTLSGGSGGAEAQMIKSWSTSQGPIWKIYMDPQGGTMTATQRGVLASPPYDLGDGEIELFLFAVVRDDGTTEAFTLCDTPPWVYNGPTNCTPERCRRERPMPHPPALPSAPRGGASKYEQQGFARRLADYEAARTAWAVELARWQALPERGYRNERIVPPMPADPALVPAWLEACADAPIVEVEIDRARELRDMALIPHSFTGCDLAGKTVVMGDPYAKAMRGLARIHQENPGIGHDLLHRGLLRFDNTALARKSPPGVMVCGLHY